MRNIRLLIEYDGTNYAGWQWQKNAKTVQETLAVTIERIVQGKITLYGAGRTDAGVHALGQMANFKTTSPIPCERLLPAINYYLPHDITVKEVAEVPASFHAQYDARSKVYRYTVFNDWIRTSLNRHFCYVSGFTLGIDKMIQTSRYLIGTHDFTSFTTQASCEKNRIRTIENLAINKDGKYIYFTVEANGFLYNMVRAIVGTLLEAGRGKIMVDQVKEILEAKNRDMAGPTAPARGLCLMEVKYQNT